MQVFRSLEEIPSDFGPTVVSVGNYDGIHRAHQRLIARDLRARQGVGRALGIGDIRSASGSAFCSPHGGPPLITPMARKLELLGETEWMRWW